jgi:signal transduction histidine kinase
VGLKLRSQIAGILFLLFTLTVLILGYFNISILYDAMKSLSEEQSSAMASNIVAWVEKSLPPGGYSEKSLLEHFGGRSDLTAYLRDVKGLRTFQVLDREGEVLYSYGMKMGPLPFHREALQLALLGRTANGRLWEYDSPTDFAGHPMGTHSFITSRFVSYEYYRPVISFGQPVAAYHISLGVEDMPRRMRVMFVGNLLLSAVFLVTAFVAISIWTAHAINRPLEFILQAQERIGRGDFTAHVQTDIPSTNEIISISSSFNRMAADLRRFKKELEIKTRRLEELNAEYKRLNEHLESEVEDKTRELKEFFSVVTHDLKVPLAAIQGYTDLLLRSKGEPLTDKQGRFVQAIATACSHLLGMTRNMMDSVKYDAGKIVYYVEDMDLQTLVEDSMSQVRQTANEKRLTLKAEVPPLCRPVRGDRTKIAQVINNLLGNAVKFTPDDGVVEVRARDRGTQVEVSVSDTGPGIAAEQMSSLFEKFTQFHTVEGASSGIGLGLYIVRKILEGHGQTIRVVSNPGQGSTFYFTLAKGTRAGQAESLDKLDYAQAPAESGLAEVKPTGEKPAPSDD